MGLKIEKRHPFTGEYNTLNLDITIDQFNDWQSGTLIQQAMPNLSAEEREFLISGLLPGDYDKLFKNDEE